MTQFSQTPPSTLPPAVMSMKLWKAQSRSTCRTPPETIGALWLHPVRGKQKPSLQFLHFGDAVSSTLLVPPHCADCKLPMCEIHQPLHIFLSTGAVAQCSWSVQDVPASRCCVLDRRWRRFERRWQIHPVEGTWKHTNTHMYWQVARKCTASIRKTAGYYRWCSIRFIDFFFFQGHSGSHIRPWINTSTWRGCLTGWIFTSALLFASCSESQPRRSISAAGRSLAAATGDSAARLRRENTQKKKKMERKASLSGKAHPPCLQSIDRLSLLEQNTLRKYWL